MAASLTMPFAHADGWPEVLRDLRSRGWCVIGLTPDAAAPTLKDVGRAVRQRPCAVVLGHEGEGLMPDALDACDLAARIPMAGGTDSLNVATAAAVALYELTR
jgi:tRNA G18 (ribose-2'-O)-methylase SpoU